MMTKDDLNLLHPRLIPVDPDIYVRDEWLPLVDEFFNRVAEIYGDTTPSVRLHAAYDDNGLVIDLDDTPWTGNQNPIRKQQVRQLVRDFHKRSRDD
jgi:hypothetical protein